MTKTCLCTICDENLSDFLRQWVVSARQQISVEPFDLVVINTGLRSNTILWLDAMNVNTITPTSFELKEFGIPRVTPKTFYSQMIRPYINTLLPEYDFIVYTDADCMFQKTDALEDVLAATKMHGLAFCVETDRSYPGILNNGLIQDYTYKSVHREGYLYDIMGHIYTHFYDDLETSYLSALNTANAGVFGMSSCNPMWTLWSDEIRRHLKRFKGSFYKSPETRDRDWMIELVSFNGVLRFNDIKHTTMPATYNWLCHLRLPLLDAHTKLMHQPDWPYDKISIVHFSGSYKRDIMPTAVRACFSQASPFSA